MKTIYRSISGSCAQVLIVACLLLSLPTFACGGSLKPRSVTLAIARSGNDLTLTWGAVTADHYHVYRDVTPAFAPDTAGGTNRIAQTANPWFTDSNAMLASSGYYYRITAVAADGSESAPSNLAYRIVHTLTYSTGSRNLHWLALQQTTTLTTAAELGASAPNIGSVIRWDPLTQAEITWDQATATGTNFTLEQGEAYGVIITAPTSINLVGANGSLADYCLAPYASDRFNLSWVSLHPDAYGSLSQVASAIPDVSRVAYLKQDGTYQSWFLLDGVWTGDNLEIGDSKTIPWGSGLAVSRTSSAGLCRSEAVAAMVTALPAGTTVARDARLFYPALSSTAIPFDLKAEWQYEERVVTAYFAYDYPLGGLSAPEKSAVSAYPNSFIPFVYLIPKGTAAQVAAAVAAAVADANGKR